MEKDKHDYELKKLDEAQAKYLKEQLEIYLKEKKEAESLITKLNLV
jgi:hypothetical protein